MTIKFSQKEHIAIRTAIKNGEKKTSAEIFAVLAQRSDDYRFVAMCFFAFWIFVVSVLLVLLVNFYKINLPALQIILAQFASFVCGYLVLRWFPKLAIMVTPQRIKYHRAHLNGIKQFLAHGIHHTEGRTGILIFVSLEERYAEILVDGEIEKNIGRDFWLEAVGELIASCKANDISLGYVRAIESISEKLAVKFPRGPKNLNELDDKLIIL